MRKTILVIAILAAVVVSSAVLAAEEAVTQAATPPSTAIFLPSGVNITTDINVTDDNVLGIVKTAASTLLDDLEDIDLSRVVAAPNVAMSGIVSNIDMRQLLESTYGIEGIRFVAAQYETTPEQFIKQFEIGVPKAGKFNRVLMDLSNREAAILVYAQPDNGGYLGAAYIPREKMIYAARIVGFIDVQQFVDVVGDVAKAYIGFRIPQTQESVNAHTSASDAQ